MDVMIIYAVDTKIFSIVTASQFRVRHRRAGNGGVTLCISIFPGETIRDREKLISAQNFLRNCLISEKYLKLCSYNKQFIGRKPKASQFRTPIRRELLCERITKELKFMDRSENRAGIV